MRLEVCGCESRGERERGIEKERERGIEKERERRIEKERERETLGKILAGNFLWLH